MRLLFSATTWNTFPVSWLSVSCIVPAIVGNISERITLYEYQEKKDLNIETLFSKDPLIMSIKQIQDDPNI
jgi:hypothetical protein